jgi:lysophospholipase L1-like esterase
MKKLFVLGDSISIHYGPYLRNMVRGVFEYARKQAAGAGLTDGQLTDANGGDSSLVLDYVRVQLAGQQPDVLLLNCGLHDLRTDPDTGGKQVPLEAYQSNLHEILRMVPPNVRLVWVRTTPVNDERHNSRQVGFHRYNRDVVRYNEVADKLCKAAGVPAVDLYTFTRNLSGELFCDHVHYHERVRELQAAFIAGHLLAWF